MTENIKLSASTVAPPPLGYPDYSKGSDLAWNTNIDITEDGWVYCTGNSQSGNYVKLYINNVEFFVSAGTFGGVCMATLFMPVKNGDTVKATGGLNSQFLKFFPIRT